MSGDQNNNATRTILGRFPGPYASHMGWVLVGMLLLAGASTARADSFDNFVLTDGTQTMTWTLPSTLTLTTTCVGFPVPAPCYTPGDHFSLTGITVLENGITPVTTTQMSFFNGNPTSDGGVAAALVNPGDFIDAFLGEQQLYTGPESNPTFTPGTYSEGATEDDTGIIPGCTATEQDAGCGVGNTWALSSSTDVPLTLTITTVPEPSSLFLLGTGLVALGIGLRRKRLA